ncbi:MAG: 2-isopropylmalate synthase [Dehalococcoidia bacterium]|jgi:isopropylmalate/homocitrate/citramalate synthase|nr:2-isopropylmalate synthase [Dehalococcoidia bacterium]
MAEYQINPEKLYYNYQGQFPPLVLDAEQAVIPPETEKLHPKLITDTTMRDGAQDPHFALFPVEARLKYYDLLHELDNGTGCIEQVEVFIYQKRDLWALDKLLDKGYEFPQVTTWTRALPKDIKMLVDVSQGRIKETGMLASSSDHHIFDKLGHPSKAKAAERYLVPIMTACEYGIRPRIHLEDTTKADIYGFVIPFMQWVLKETNGWAKFRICDTIGWGSPDPYAPLPVGIPKLISTLVQETGAELEFHGHNDFGLATANSIAAYRYGCKRVNVAFAGLGERTGNTSLEQMVAAYIRMYGDPGFNLKTLSQIRDLLTREVIEIPPKQPIIGDVFSTQAGLHQTGMSRGEQAEGGTIYLAFDASVVGEEAEEHSVIGALSGMDGIVAVLNQQIKVETGQQGRYTTTSRVVKYIYDKIQEAYDGTYDSEHDVLVDQRRTFFTPAELSALAKEAPSKQRVPARG